MLEMGAPESFWVILAHGAQLRGVAVPHKAAQVELSAHGAEHVAAEAVLFLCDALLHKLDEKVQAQKVDLKPAVARGRVRRAARLGHFPRIVERKVGRVFHKCAVCRAHAGDVRAARLVRLQHLLERQIDDEVAVGEDDVLLPNLPQVRTHARERVDLAAEHRAAVFSLVGKGLQELEPAISARHVPCLAVADVVNETLIVAVQHDADIRNARVVHIGEHEVDRAVAPAKGYGAGHTLLRQLAKAGCFRIGKDNTVQSVHRTVSFPSALRMRFAAST